jgi:ribosomal protein L19
MKPTPIEFKDIRVGDHVQVKTLCFNKITTNTFEGIVVRVSPGEACLGDPDREFDYQDVVKIGPEHFSRKVEYFLVDRPQKSPFKRGQVVYVRGEIFHPGVDVSDVLVYKEDGEQRSLWIPNENILAGEKS